MSATPNACALGLSGQTLSAWRDHTLPDAQAQQITQHVRHCAACQRRLSQFTRIATALQHQSVPDLRARTWQGIQRTHARSEHPMRNSRFAAFSGIGAVAAVAAIVLVSLVLLSHRPTTNTGPGGPIIKATPTATVFPTPPVCDGFPAGYHPQLPDPGYTSTSVFANLPLPPRSRIVPNNASGGVRGYDICSSGTVDSITSYMAQQLTALGWASSGNGTWTKDGYTLNVQLTSATQWSISWRDPDEKF